MWIWELLFHCVLSFVRTWKTKTFFLTPEVQIHFGSVSVHDVSLFEVNELRRLKLDC